MPPRLALRPQEGSREADCLHLMWLLNLVAFAVQTGTERTEYLMSATARVPSLTISGTASL
jgi:hypothetical protein